jgi:cbb3-type cytochrome c oxidase subunit III
VRVAGLVILAGFLGLVLAACGSSGPGVSHGEDLAQGRELFVNGDGGVGEPTCGSCHTLAAAGTSGVAGPNLDDAFRASREDGFEESTFEQIVREQIAYPGIGLGMPADLLEGTDADNVAYFVARCAANEKDPACTPPSGEITATEGSEIFAQADCGSCHTLAAAGSSGTVGPNLDQAKPSVELVIDRVTNGAGAMPSFKDRMSEEQIKALADYVSQSAGG